MITILVGISGSGKSTFARKYMEQALHTTVRINRDDLRRGMFMMDEDYYSHPDFKKRENLITEVCDQMIYDALNKNYDVIIDNTNLQRKYINEIIRKFNHLSFIDMMFFDVSLDEAKKRVQERDGVNTDYITRQFNEYTKLKKQLDGTPILFYQTAPKVSFNESLPKAYVFDIDGNLALKGDRDIFDDSRLHLDSEIKPVGEVLRSLYATNHRIIFLSGRQASCYDTTKQWLIDNDLWTNTSEMFMRKTNDYRCDSIVKEELFMEHVAPKYNVLGVFDDRLRVNRTWYKLGVFCFNTNQNLIQF